MKKVHMNIIIQCHQNKPSYLSYRGLIVPNNNFKTNIFKIESLF